MLSPAIKMTPGTEAEPTLLTMRVAIAADRVAVSTRDAVLRGTDAGNRFDLTLASFWYRCAAAHKVDSKRLALGLPLRADLGENALVHAGNFGVPVSSAGAL